jgi:hypothetical protein
MLKLLWALAARAFGVAANTDAHRIKSGSLEDPKEISGKNNRHH